VREVHEGEVERAGAVRARVALVVAVARALVVLAAEAVAWEEEEGKKKGGDWEKQDVRRRRAMETETATQHKIVAKEKGR
jgi:hypothetical protein